MIISQHFGAPDVHISLSQSQNGQVSYFVNEKMGTQHLQRRSNDHAKVNDPNIRLQAQEFLEYGEAKEGYWTANTFMNQMEMAVKMAEMIAEMKYPKGDGWWHVWIFDPSSCHAAMADYCPRGVENECRTWKGTVCDA